MPKGMTVEAALQEWYEFRDQNELDNTKAKLMGGKLVEWCEKNNILLLTALTTDKVIKWRLTLPFRSGDSSSLSVHWSVIGGFFSWAAGMGYIEKSPIPNPKINPVFRIRYEKAEVNPPSKKQVEKILATATGQVRLLCQLMRETAMALVDAMKYGMSQEDAEKYGLSKPERRPVIKDRVIRGNRTKTNERYRVRISESLAKRLEALGEPAFPGTYPSGVSGSTKSSRMQASRRLRMASGTTKSVNGFRLVCMLTTWRTWWARRPRKSARRTVTGLRKLKTAWTKYSVRRG